MRALIIFLLAGPIFAQSGAFRRDRMDAIRDTLATQRTTGFLVMQHDRIVYEWYADGWSATRPHGTASLAKALVGGMSLLVAMNDGRIRPDDLASRYIPAWREDPVKSKITIRQLATHSSGISDAEQDGLAHDQLPGWKGAFWKRTPDPFSIAIEQAPTIFDPGARFQYSNPGMAALAYAVTASLKEAPQRDIRTLLAGRIMGPLEVPPSEWSIGYGQAYELDGLQLYANWGGGSYTARAAARVGQFMAHRGNWNGRQLIDPRLIAQATSYAGTPLPDRDHARWEPGSGLGWWTNFDRVWSHVPPDAFAGAGAGHQVLLVVPSLELVVVRNGDAMKDDRRDSGFFGPIVRYLFDPVMHALETDQPYPPSPVIGGIAEAPENEIVRAAVDSDNWPITWGDDGDLYTAYGDGFGFEPLVDRKLSLGFARIEGPGAGFHGVNIRSETGEREGNGASGVKASGMLMVDGVLYMWVRNADNAQLAWSGDRARTWQWGFRFDQSFGSPSFLNFGQNYAGARDGFVYAYSQDGASAYESNDRIVLARAPKERLRDRDAWEFFVRLNSRGEPEWSRDIARRGGVFTFAGHCQRTDAVYHPFLKRYLLLVGYNHKGGWGIYDAPNPWGPWSTVLHTEYWRLGGTHGYRLPSKWIGQDAMYLVFSGVKLPAINYDAFCVRKVSLLLR